MNKFVTGNGEIKRAAISGAAANNELVAAVAGKKIRVLALTVIALTSVGIRFEDGSGGTALTGVMTVADNGAIAFSYTPMGWFETSVNTALNMELSGTVQVSGALIYQEVD